VVEIAPGWFLSRTKLHLLVAHVVENIKRFSLLKNYHEEPFESNNAVLRFASIYSNRRAASRDIGRTMEQTQSLRHLISGGFYYSDQRNEWIQAGVGVRNFMKQTTAFQQLYGLMDNTDSVPGRRICHLANRAALITAQAPYTKKQARILLSACLNWINPCLRVCSYLQTSTTLRFSSTMPWSRSQRTHAD
jgi:hypothetical protein